MRKLISLRVYGRIEPNGCQVVTYEIISRTRARRWVISTMFGPDEPGWNMRLLINTVRRLRAGWRDEVLGKGWQRRKAEARLEREREAAVFGNFRRRYDRPGKDQ